MFIFDIFWSVLSFFGISFNVPGKVLFLGLDNAGKTTLLRVLTTDKLGSFPPTNIPNVEELTLGKLSIKAIDLGGHDLGRKLWENYFNIDITAIVFVIDTSDTERFELVKELLSSLLEKEILKSTPILVLGNKIDKPKAVSEMELVNSVGLYGVLTGKKTKTTKRPVELFMCSIKEQMGYGEGFQWLSQYLY